jgi:hypothetical protein
MGEKVNIHFDGARFHALARRLMQAPRGVTLSVREVVVFSRRRT